jgi:hypothetical protein
MTMLEHDPPAATVDRRARTLRPLSAATPSLAFDWAMSALGAVFVGGLFLDGWAHTHGRVDETFFTPWHAVLYSGYLLTAGFLIATLLRNVAKGHPWRRALPPGYGLSVIGATLWVIGGPGDLLWHELFGFEANVEALLSPAHLVLALGGGLMLSGPLRAAWRRSDAELEGWGRRLPMLLSFTYVLSLMGFFLQIAHPIANLWGAEAVHPIDADEMGIVSILLWAAVMMSAVLLLLRHRAIPFGGLALVLALNAIGTGFLYDHGVYPILPVAAFVGGGIAAEALRALLKPSVQRPRAWRLFAFGMPAVLHLFYFLTLLLTAGVWWSIHLWLGAVAFSGVVGWLISYLLLPPSSGELLTPA